MVKFWSVAVLAAVSLAASSSSVEAQNAGVHAALMPDTESRAAPVAPASATPSGKTGGPAPKAPSAVAAPSPAAPKPVATPTVAPTSKKTRKPNLAVIEEPNDNKPAPKVTPATPTPTTLPPLTDSSTWLVHRIKTNPSYDGCYRRVSLANNKQCSNGYAFDGYFTCWSQCPLEYPVQCGFECIPQNKDCALAVVDKASAVANTVLSVATNGIFGAFKATAKGAKFALACGQGLYDVATQITAEVEKLTAGSALTSKDKAKEVITKTDFFMYDLPVAIATCMGVDLPADYLSNRKFLKKAEQFVVAIIDMKFEKINPLDPKNFINFYTSFKDFWVKDSAATDKKLPEVTAEEVTQLGQAATTCGGQLKAYFAKVRTEVQKYIANPPKGAQNIEYVIYNLPLVLEDLPKATVNCWKSNAPDGVKTRDEIITAAKLITEQMVKTAKTGAKQALKTVAQYKLEIAHFALDAIAVYDPTGIADLVKKFLMPICPISEFKGTIERGPLDKALGLKIIGKAFQGTTGTWNPQGDGLIHFSFDSVDNENVKLNIMSGGKKLHEWDAIKGGTLVWNLKLSEFAGKTLYIDRWRPGILGFWGTGGGSLSLWIPDNTKGSITLEGKINPTQLGD